MSLNQGITYVKMVLFILVIVSAVFLAGCQTSTQIASRACEVMKDPAKKAHCLQAVAIQGGESSYCGDIQSSPETNCPKARCYYEVALKTGDPEDCKGIGWEAAGCGYDDNLCIADVAVKFKDSNICEMIGAGGRITKEGCIKKVG